MGEEADYYIEQIINPFSPQRRRRSRYRVNLNPAPKHTLESLGNLTWTTKEGEILNIADMEHSHRKNALQLLKRRMTEGELEKSSVALALKVYIFLRENNVHLQ